MCTGVVSDDAVSACSSLKGLWRWVGLLVDALLLVRSEAVERGPLMVSVRSPSARTKRQGTDSLSATSSTPENALSQGRWASSSQGSLITVALLKSRGPSPEGMELILLEPIDGDALLSLPGNP